MTETPDEKSARLATARRRLDALIASSKSTKGERMLAFVKTLPDDVQESIWNSVYKFLVETLKP